LWKKNQSLECCSPELENNSQLARRNNFGPDTGVSFALGWPGKLRKNEQLLRPVNGVADKATATVGGEL
jgi:hypothetical protein